METASKIKAFFQQYKDLLHGEAFVVYGLGKNARKLLQVLAHTECQGVLDGQQGSGTFCDWPILPIEELPARGIRYILIAAELSSTKIIYDRIRDFCFKKKITVHGLYTGLRDLHQVFDKGLCGYEDNCLLCRQDIIAQIDCHDVISFDVFDTLLMRQTLYPADVFALVSGRAAKAGHTWDAFAVHRMQAELFVLRHGQHTLDAIYTQLQSMYKWTDNMREWMKNLELQTEQDIIVPRKDVVACLRYACDQGKQVNLISDMYLSTKQLEYLLQYHGIKGYNRIFVSNEYGHGKQRGLFKDYLSQVLQGQSYLHIGDNKEADGLAARVAGIDACVIRNSLDLLRLSKYRELEYYASTIGDKMVLGMCLARVANSPFSLMKDKSFFIPDFATFVYAFMAPVFTAFLAWFMRECQKISCDAILFAARDGYLIKRLYENMVAQGNYPNAPLAVYFYTSRKAAMKFGMKKREDIVQAQDWFGKDFIDCLFGGVDSDTKDGQSAILDTAKQYRDNLFVYLKQQSIDLYKHYIFYDFSSQGTTQYYLQNAGMKYIKGCYFQYYACDRPVDVPIQAYDEAPYIGRQNVLYQERTLFECVTSSPELSLECFSELGTPVFVDNIHWKNDWEMIQKAQKQVEYFVQKFIDEGEWIHGQISKTLVLRLARCMQDNYHYIEKDLRRLRVSDTVRGTLIAIH